MNEAGLVAIAMIVLILVCLSGMFYAFVQRGKRIDELEFEIALRKQRLEKTEIQRRHKGYRAYTPDGPASADSDSTSG